MGFDKGKIGHLIREDRKRLGETQPEYARRLGLSTTKVARLEQEKFVRPSADVMERLARRFPDEGGARDLPMEEADRSILLLVRSAMDDIGKHAWRTFMELLVRRNKDLKEEWQMVVVALNSAEKNMRLSGKLPRRPSKTLRKGTTG